MNAEGGRGGSLRRVTNGTGRSRWARRRGVSIGCAAFVACAASFPCAAFLTACRSSGPGTSPTPDGAGAMTGPELPVDHLRTGELLEGSAQAFGVVLPRSFQVDGAFVDAVYATGPGTVHPVVEYFSRRVEGGDVRESEPSATLDHVHAPGHPDRSLRIHVATTPQGVRVEVHDETPVKLPSLPDEAARWRRAGFTPSGRVIDPEHIE